MLLGEKKMFGFQPCLCSLKPATEDVAQERALHHWACPLAAGVLVIVL